MVKVKNYSEEYREKVLSAAREGMDESAVNALAADLSAFGKASSYLIALDEGDSVLGYGKTTLLTKGLIELNDVYVLPSDRRTGTGSLILVAILTKAVEKFVVGVTAKCTADNVAAISFFTSRGFCRGDDVEGYACFAKNIMHMYRRKPSDK